jgi:hypothetical protein
MCAVGAIGQKQANVHINEGNGGRHHPTQRGYPGSGQPEQGTIGEDRPPGKACRRPTGQSGEG